MMGVLQLIKKCLLFPFQIIKRLYRDLRASFYLEHNSKHSHNKQSKNIKVGFVVQVPQLWDKQSSVYSAMCKDKEFEPFLIIVPSYDLIHNRIDDYGEELDYFKEQCQNGKYILAYNGEDWVDMEKEKFNYLFYQRPYDPYLPKSLTSDTTVRFTKICYIPYATPEIKNTGIYPRYFFRNLYCGFMENQEGADKNIAIFRKNCKKNIQHFLNIGYPAFERCINHQEACRYNTFLWTPRWSYDPVAGGSHFMEYYSQLTDLEWNDAKLIVRPHPMMWENFIKTKLLDEKQIEDILSKWDENNIVIDKNESIDTTFSQTDVMISDRSSVIPMFFLTRKPIIYCPMDMDVSEYGDLFSSLLPGLYIANDWNELEHWIKMLMSKNDPLADVRSQIIEKKFSNHYSATEKIINTIKSDFFQK